MLVSSKQIILDAQKGGYAVGCFNTSDLEVTKAIIAAAEAQRAPIIIATSEKAINYAGLDLIAIIVKIEAEKASVPVALHLDHGQSIDMIKNCIEEGYTSLMFDGSKMVYEENIKMTKKAVKLAHLSKIPCEGELGRLSKAGEESSDFTNPDEINPYVKQTGVDTLAISIGSRHGMEKEEPLNIELLKKIRSLTQIPLVLHGASGVSDEDVKAAIKNGISKINIDTDIRHTFANAMRNITAQFSEMQDSREILTKAMIEVQRLVENKIKLFGSNNKI